MDYTQGVTEAGSGIRHAILIGGDQAHSACGRDVIDLAEAWPPPIAGQACGDCMEILQKELLAPEN